MAARTQTSIPEIADLEREPEATRKLYAHGGEKTANPARNCLPGLHLIELGVRFGQIYRWASGNSCDARSNLVKNHENMAREFDRPVAGPLEDLRSRGLLEDTLVTGVT